MFKKIFAVLFIALLFAGCAAPATDTGRTDEQLIEEGWVKNPEDQGYVLMAELPAPREEAGNFAADASSINFENLDQYLGRNDVMYIDVRDYNNYAQKHFKNFEVIPYFAYIFNENAHVDDNLVQLFGGTPEEPIATYTSSEAILNALFPKDTTLFIMCQSGARVVWLMQILEANGYDMDLIYNVGGLGQYTDSKYASYITDTEEFVIDVDYRVEGVTPN